MGKQKIGKKDIFAPTTKTEKADEHKTKSHRETQHSSKRIKKAPKTKDVQENKPVESQRMIIHSFRMREDLIEGIREYAFFERVKIYEVINAAVEDFLEKNKEKTHTRS